MSNFYIRDLEQAQAILRAYNHCTICSECSLNGPEGWKCSYLAELAQQYIEEHRQDQEE